METLAHANPFPTQMTDRPVAKVTVESAVILCVSQSARMGCASLLAHACAMTFIQVHPVYQSAQLVTPRAVNVQPLGFAHALRSTQGMTAQNPSAPPPA